MSYEKGKAIRVSVEFKDNNGTYIDPTSPVIKIKKSSGVVIVASTALTKDTTGHYHYIWDTDDDMSVGDYYITCNGTYSGHNIFERTKVELVVVS
jgi:hypothetical protein